MINISLLLIKISIIYIREDIKNSGKGSFRLDSLYLALLVTSITDQLKGFKKENFYFDIGSPKFSRLFSKLDQGALVSVKHTLL